MGYLCTRLQYGFDILISDTNLKTKECKHLSNAPDNTGTVQEILETECAKGFAYGP